MFRRLNYRILINIIDVLSILSPCLIPTSLGLSITPGDFNVTGPVSPRSGNRTLTILGLFPVSGQWEGGQAMIPAVQLAFRDINARKDILPDYNLVLEWADTACDPGVGVNSMYELLHRPPEKLMVLGAGCSPVTETTARASHLWNLVQISYVSASPALSNKHRFPRFFRVGAPEVALNPTKIEMMRHFGWSKVATIHESIDVFSTVTEDFVKRLPEHNITLITSEIFTDDPTIQVENLKKHDARIIMAGAHYAALYKLMCAAFHAGLYGPRYVWMLPGWYQDGWWTERVYAGSTVCTAAQIQEAARGYIGLGTVYINPEQEVGVSGYTPATWEAEMTRTSGYPRLPGSYVAAQGYDAAWAVALSLNYTDAQLHQQGIRYGLDGFSYNNAQLADLIFSNMWKVDFQGIKGHMFYDENGDCLDKVQINRFQDNMLPIVAYHQPGSGEAIEWLKSSPILWENGHPPKDSTRKITRLLFVPETTYGAMVGVAAAGVTTAAVLLTFNIVFRNERLIKMSSPVLNNVILVGCVVCYSTVVFQERTPDTTYVFCKVRSMTVMVGFSMTFGALFVKTWRVYVIFMNKTKKTVLRDVQLVAMVSILVLLDVVLFVTQIIVDPHSVAKTIVSTQEEHGDLVIEETVSVCVSKLSVHFMAVNYIIKGLLLIFGVFLAWQTRKVTIPALNDSHYIGMCIYNVVVLSTVGVLLASVLRHQVALQYVLVNGVLVLGVSITQLIIFIPKIYKFWQLRLKIGDGSMEEETGTTLSVHATVHSSTDGECNYAKCHVTISRLREETSKLSKELADARQQTQETGTTG